MVDVPRSVRDHFLAAGWHPGRHVPIHFDRLETLRSYPLAAELLATFGGLHVGECGPGRDCAKSDIEFTLLPSQNDRYAVIDEESPGDDLFPLGEAHRRHYQIFLDARGRLVVYSPISGDLWVMGETFAAGVERLLLGHAP
jgi:hypothetical protein